MLKQKDAQIINISSVAGIYPRKSNFEYALTKASIIHFTKCLALLLSPKVRVNCIAPSYTWSNFMSFMKDRKKVAEKMKLVPFGRFNDPEDIAEAALYLASPGARNVTGQVLIIDGGRGSAI
jgi:3-oxoacyl-[acyl-carrier protein] reductase